MKTRRTFLRSAGVTLALPWLESFASEAKPRSAGSAKTPRRMVCICAPLGFLPENFIPGQSGADYTPSPYLEPFADYRKDFTVISGLMHAGMSSGLGHQASASFLTGVPGAGRPGFRNAISLDQLAAESIGMETRFPSLVLSAENLVNHNT